MSEENDLLNGNEEQFPPQQGFVPEERTILDWLCCTVNFQVDEQAASDILSNRGVDVKSAIEDVEKKDKDLCKADLFVWLCTSPTRKGDDADSDNSWAHKVGGYTLSEADKKRLMAMANAIYEMYDEEKPYKSKVRIHSFGIHKRHKCF